LTPPVRTRLSHEAQSWQRRVSCLRPWSPARRQVGAYPAQGQGTCEPDRADGCFVCTPPARYVAERLMATPRPRPAPQRGAGVVSSYAYATISAGLGRFLSSRVLSAGVAMTPQGIGQWLRGRRGHPGAGHAHQRVGGARRTSWAPPAHAAHDGAAQTALSPSPAGPGSVSLHEDPEPPGTCVTAGTGQASRSHRLAA
jgi:hypothetical protein